MGALTQEVPKPMLVVGGHTILEHILDRLGAAGIAEALVVTGYLGEQIESGLSRCRMPIEFRRQEALDGTARAALLAREWAGAEDFLLTFGDILAEAEDYRGLIAMLEADPASHGVVAVQYAADPWRGAAVYEASGLLTAIFEKPPPGTSSTHWNSAGIYAFRTAVFDELARVPMSPRGEYELTSAIEQMIAAGRALRMYTLRGTWRDVGRPEDLEAAGNIL